VVLHLDLRIAMEAVILNRLECLPRSRRQEWLRGLLVDGFRAECQALRGAAADAARRPTSAFTHRMAGEAQKPLGLTQPEPTAVKVKPPHAKPAGKPFAALGKVIGAGSTAT
jgi:hypothetical protein